MNTPLGGVNAGLSLGKGPSNLITTAITVVGGLMLFSFLLQVGCGNSIDLGCFSAAFQATFGAGFWAIFCPIILGTELQ